MIHGSQNLCFTELQVLSQALRVEHAAAPPKERRANSWSRTLAFAQMTLGIRGHPMRSGSSERELLPAKAPAA